MDLLSASLWASPPLSPLEREPLSSDVQVDIAIVGAGYSGLWVAHYLLDHDPNIRIAIVDRARVGFGASGRNGGWCIGELAAGHDALARAGTAVSAIRQMRAMFDAVDEVGRVTRDHHISCDFHKGGTIRLGRNAAQVAAQRTERDQLHALGFDDTDVRLVSAADAATQLAATRVAGGLFFSHTAALHPAKLVHGLADMVVRRGAQIYERTAAISIQPGRVDTEHGTIRAEVVIRATEGYTRDLPGHRRTLAPIYSLMIATEQLPASTWSEIGLADRQTFCDDRHLVIYGQRTADDRIAFGGRGAPYGFGSRIDPSIEVRSSAHAALANTLHDLLPQTAGTKITHRWGGVLGVPRDWFPSVEFDRTSGLGALGGYVGEGVAAANLAGRTLADLIVGAATERTTYPWVGHRSPRWEPEPLRWLAINGALRAMAFADWSERRGRGPSTVARAVYRLLG